MIPPVQCAVAFVTAPDLEVARRLSKAALEQKLAACANILPGVESHYWWQGRIENTAEVMIVFKTTIQLQLALRDCVLANHPYETPEFIVVNIDQGSNSYLQWVRDNVLPRAPR